MVFGIIPECRSESSRIQCSASPESPIKRLKGDHSMRFQQEARAIAAINHPHICQISTLAPTTWYWSSSKANPSAGRMRLEEAAELVAQIASALELAHKPGILNTS